MRTVCLLGFSMADVSKPIFLSSSHPIQAASPDVIASCVLRACAEQLAGVFMDIFRLSISQFVVPTCFKVSSIVPVPKKVKVTELKDYCHVALTSVIMKCFEKLVKDHITSTLPDT